ncbi:hypothetical protein D3C81_2309070 [compost metagenome]
MFFDQPIRDMPYRSFVRPASKSDHFESQSVALMQRHPDTLTSTEENAKPTEVREEIREVA